MKGKDSIHFSSGNDCWGTPQDLFDSLNKIHGFNIDVCALPENAMCHTYCIPPVGAEHHVLWPGTALVDAFNQDLSNLTCWMNPPYSQLYRWLGLADKWRRNGSKFVCLFPSRTDTKAWHDFVWDTEACTPRPGVDVNFLKGRLKFKGAKDPAPFPSVVVTFNPIKQ